MKPYFGEESFTPELKQRWLDYYEDVEVLAFPTPGIDSKISDIYEKALYYRDPYSSMPGVKAFIPSFADYIEPLKGSAISTDKIIDVTCFLKSDSILDCILFIDYALNDRVCGLEKAYAARNQMIKLAKEQGIKIILLTPSPDQTVNIADSFKAFEFLYADNEKLSNYMAQVNHPNELGHELIVNELIKWFK